MKISVQHGLPFVNVTVQFRGQRLLLEKVLIDTGSVGTLFNADSVGAIGVLPEEVDVVDIIRGVGGFEYVYRKHFDKVQLGNACIENFQVEIGTMDYGMEIDGIIGFDFMSAVNLVIDTKHMSVFQA